MRTNKEPSGSKSSNSKPRKKKAEPKVPALSLDKLLGFMSRKVVEIESDVIERSEFAGLTFRQLAYLETIGRLQGPTVSELARVFEVSRPSATVATDRLARADYLLKLPSEQDRRAVHLHLTDKGRQVSQLHEQAHHRMAELFRSALSQEDVKHLQRLLNQIAAHVETDLQDSPS